jgi:hypothetical protein
MFTGMMESKQRLIFENKLLEDTDTIGSTKIKDGQTIIVVEAGSGYELLRNTFK